MDALDPLLDALGVPSGSIASPTDDPTSLSEGQNPTLDDPTPPLDDPASFSDTPAPPSSSAEPSPDTIHWLTHSELEVLVTAKLFENEVGAMKSMYLFQSAKLILMMAPLFSPHLISKSPCSPCCSTLISLYCLTSLRHIPTVVSECAQRLSHT